MKRINSASVVFKKVQSTNQQITTDLLSSPISTTTINTFANQLIVPRRVQSQSLIKVSESKINQDLQKDMRIASMIRFKENKGLKPEAEFNKFMKKIASTKNATKKIISQTQNQLKNTQKVIKNMTIERRKEDLFLEYLVDQEEKVKSLSHQEQEDFQKFREKQMRVLNIKSFVHKTRKIKLIRGVKDMMNNLKMDKNESQKVVKYLTNDKTLSSKKLQKPLYVLSPELPPEIQLRHKNPSSKNAQLPLDFFNIDQYKDVILFDDSHYQSPLKELISQKSKNKSNEEQFEETPKSKNYLKNMHLQDNYSLSNQNQDKILNFMEEINDQSSQYPNQLDYILSI